MGAVSWLMKAEINDGSADEQRIECIHGCGYIHEQGDQDSVARWYVFKSKIHTNLGKFWKVLQKKMLVFLIAIWSILRPNSLFYGQLVLFMYGQRVYFFPFWYFVL
jgi:hypothetical protein